MDQQEIRVFGLACAHNTITGILLLCGPVYFGPALHARLYLVLYVRRLVRAIPEAQLLVSHIR